MPIRFVCHQCHQAYEGVDQYMGRAVSCPACNGPIQVPFQSDQFQIIAPPGGPPSPTPLAPALTPLPPASTPAASPAPAGTIPPQVLAQRQQQFQQQLVALVQGTLQPGAEAAIVGRNLGPDQLQKAGFHVCPEAEPNSILAVIGDFSDELRKSFVLTHTHAYSKYRQDRQMIPLEEIATATADSHVVVVNTHRGDRIEVEGVREFRPAIAALLQQVAQLNQQLPRRQPDRWQGKPFPIDLVLLQHWDPQQDLIFRCDVGIPRKRLAGAVKAFGAGVSESDVLGLFDNTLLASGKEGLLFTRDKLYYTEKFVGPGSVPYWRIRGAEAGETHADASGKVKLLLDSGKLVIISHTSVTPLGPLFRATFQAIAAISNKFAAG